MLDAAMTFRDGFQTPIRTTIGFLGLAPPRGLATLCTDHCMTCEALPIRAMRT